MAKDKTQGTEQPGAGEGLGGMTAGPAAAAEDPRAGIVGQLRRPAIVGEPVQYLPSGNDAKHVPALITRIEDNGDVGLYVLRPEFNAPEWRDGVKEGRGAGEFRRLEDAMDEARG